MCVSVHVKAIFRRAHKAKCWQKQYTHTTARIPYRYKFPKVIKFCGFQGHQATVKNNPSKIFVKLHPRKNTPLLGKTSSRMKLLRNFRPTTKEKLCVLFSFAITCSLIHEYHRTTIIQKECGNYTHNKSAKI